MNSNIIRWFSTEYQWIQRKLLIDINLIDPYFQKESESVKWLIDTWATCCMISKRIADRLWLISVWKSEISTAWWSHIVNKYLTKLKLPDNFISDAIFVTEWPLDDQWFDVLIGMDILSQWDFAMSKRNWNTLISFVTPSQQPIDLVNKYKQVAHLQTQEQKRLNGHNNRKKTKKRK